MTAETPQEAPEAADPSSDTPETGEGATDDESANSREARYRIRARDAEAARDGLQATVTNLRARVAELQVGDRLMETADLWRHVDVDDLLSEDGDIDSDKVTDAVDRIAEQRPHLIKRRPPKPDYTMGHGASQRPGYDTGTGWQEVLRGNNSR